MLTIYINGIRYMNHDEKKTTFLFKKRTFYFSRYKKTDIQNKYCALKFRF